MMASMIASEESGFFLFVFIRTTNASFLCFLRRKTSSSLFHQLVSGGLTSNQESRYDGAPCSAYLIQIAPLDFVQDAVCAQQAEFTAYERRAAFSLSGIGRG